MNRKIAAMLMTGVMALSSVSYAFADNLSQAKKNKETIEQQLNKVQQKKTEMKKQTEVLKKESSTLSQKQKTESENYKKLVEEIEAIDKEIQKITMALEQSEEDYKAQQELLKKRLRVMAEHNSVFILETLLKSNSLTDFFQRLEIVKIVARKDRQLVEDLRAAKEDVEYKKLQTEMLKAQTSKKADQKREELRNLTVSRAGIEERLKQTQQQLKILEKQEDELEKQSKEWEQIIKKLSSRNTKYIGGNMVWPVPSSNRVTSPYGWRIHPIFKVRRFHTGIDIDAQRGTSIVAAAAGTVIWAGTRSGYGKTVIIDHGGGISTLYAHCSSILVSEGQRVKAGDVIAKIGSTGYSTGPHLHFEVRKDGQHQDPMKPVK